MCVTVLSTRFFRKNVYFITTITKKIYHRNCRYFISQGGRSEHGPMLGAEEKKTSSYLDNNTRYEKMAFHVAS